MKILYVAIPIFIVCASYSIHKPAVVKNKYATIGRHPLSLRNFDSVLVLEKLSETSANISLADLNGDGFVDVVLAKGRHWPLFNKILLNNHKGNFPVSINLGVSPDKTYSTILADLDKDGDMDIVVSNDNPDEKQIYFNNGKGVFQLSQNWGNPKWNTRNATVADLNNDGMPDIIAANRNEPSYFCLNDGTGKFSTTSCQSISSESATTIIPGDFNKDGSIDLAIPHRDGGKNYIFFNDGKANFTQQKQFGPPINNARTGAAGDINKDGWIDLVVGDEKQGTFVYLNDTKGGFRPPFALGDKRISSAIMLGDLNNDGLLDIVVGYNQSKTTAFFNGGNGTSFTDVSMGDGKGVVYGMALGDINKDGFLDIGVACSDASNVIYINQPIIRK
jgi:hypothetical protein